MVKRAYSLIEMIVVLGIMAALAIVAVPRLQFATVDERQAEATARKIATDLRRVRSLALGQAATSPMGFALVFGKQGSTIEFQLKNLQTGEILDSHRVKDTVEVECVGGKRFGFSPLGSLQSGSGHEVRIVSGDALKTVAVTPATGMVRITGS